jgi:peptide/bleomycin uptake transporter
MVIVPYLVMAPSLFAGAITLGVIIQISNAFQRVHNSFSLFISQWTTITELRSIFRRLNEFEIAIGYKKN